LAQDAAAACRWQQGIEIAALLLHRRASHRGPHPPNSMQFGSFAYYLGDISTAVIARLRGNDAMSTIVATRRPSSLSLRQSRSRHAPPHRHV